MYSLEEFQSLHIFSPSYLDAPPPKRFIQFIPFISAALQYRIQALDQKHLNHQAVSHVFQQAKSLNKWAGSHIMFRSTVFYRVCVYVCFCLSVSVSPCSFSSLYLYPSLYSLYMHTGTHTYIHTYYFYITLYYSHTYT